MSLRQTSADSAVALAQSMLGRSRKSPLPCAWAKSPTIDDCAKFQSWLLWGPNAAGEGPIAWVDDFKTAPNGSYISGKAGLQRGDVVLFDWDGNGIGNHVEMATIAPAGIAAPFQTIGANGSDTINVGYRNRNGYVLGYFRPAYGTKPVAPSPAGTGGTTVITPITRKLVEDPESMQIILFNNGKGGQSYQSVTLWGRHNISADFAKALVASTPGASWNDVPTVNANAGYALDTELEYHRGEAARIIAGAVKG